MPAEAGIQALHNYPRISGDSFAYVELQRRENKAWAGLRDNEAFTFHR